eukprot:2612026-Rhodomonas_salina.1
MPLRTISARPYAPSTPYPSPLGLTQRRYPIRTVSAMPYILSPLSPRHAEPPFFFPVVTCRRCWRERGAHLTTPPSTPTESPPDLRDLRYALSRAPVQSPHDLRLGYTPGRSLVHFGLGSGTLWAGLLSSTLRAGLRSTSQAQKCTAVPPRSVTVPCYRGTL